jgi:hypothetical protein
MFKRACGRREAPVTSGDVKEDMLDAFLEKFHNSTGSIAQEVGICQFCVTLLKRMSFILKAISCIRNCMLQILAA